MCRPLLALVPEQVMARRSADQVADAEHYHLRSVKRLHPTLAALEQRLLLVPAQLV